MKTIIVTRIRSLWIAALALIITLGLVQRSDAGYKTVVNGITVTYSISGMAFAYYNSSTDTVDVYVGGTNGHLNVVVGRDATNYFPGGYVDIYLSGIGNVKSATIRGTSSTKVCLAGTIDSVKNFSLVNGIVGMTDFYGRDYGLGRYNETNAPSSISIRKGWATSQVLGFSNRPRPTASKLDPAAQAEKKALLEMLQSAAE